MQGQVTTLSNANQALAQQVNNQYSDYTGRDYNTNSRITSEQTTRAAGDLALSNTLTVVSSASTPAALNANAAFNVWPDGYAIPYSWSDWGYGWTGSRYAGINGHPYALNYQAPAGRSTGIYQFVRHAFGAFVFGCTVEASDYQGAGLYADWFRSSDGVGYGSVNINFTTEADNSGWTGRYGYKRTFTKFFQTQIDGNIDALRLYVMANWEGNGERVAKDITFHEAWIRPASASEIAAQRADNNANTALAQISAEVGTRTSLTDSLTYNVNTMRSQYDGQIGTINSQVSSLSNASQQANSSITTLQGQYTGVRNDLNNWNGDRYNQIVAVNSRVDSLVYTVNNNQQSLSGRLDTYNTNFNGLSATVSQQSGAISDAYGRTRAFVQFTGNAGNGRAQLTFYADGNGGGGVDLVGDMSLSGNLLVGGTVTTGKVANDAITNFASFDNGNYYYDNGTNQSIFEADFYVDNDSKIIVGLSGQQSYSGSSGNDPWNMTIYVDGAGLQSRGGAGGISDVVCFVAGRTVGAGWHHISATWSGSYYVHLANSQLFYQAAKK